jgi:tol-pal system protein YbgF
LGYWTIALLLGVALSGCSEITSGIGGGSVVREDLGQVRQDLNALTLGIHRSKTETETLLTQIDRRSREQAEELQRQLAQLQARTEAISQELARITGKLDEIQHRLDGGNRQPTGRAPSSTPPVSSSTPTAVSPGSTTPSVTPGTPVTAPRTAPASRGPQPSDLYQTAYIDFSKGNYTLAIAGFQEFIRRFPDSDLADNAQYWIGESHFSLARAYQNQGDQEKAKQSLEQAVQEFRKVVLTYPRGDKVPTALYKEAVALTELKQTTLAEARLRYLVENFPQSEEASLARDRLTVSRSPAQ